MVAYSAIPMHSGTFIDDMIAIVVKVERENASREMVGDLELCGLAITSADPTVVQVHPCGALAKT